MGTIYTIGHSTRGSEEFIELLKKNGIKEVADVRTIAKSRHNPQFGEEELKTSLAEAGIEYRRWPGLGGLRHARVDSTNLGWKNASFRGFADYMQTEAFAEALSSLKKAAEAQSTALMCAEAVPWRCHRSLIGDALTVEGWRVLDIISTKAPQPHRLTPFLQVVHGQLGYPSAP